MNRRAGFAGDSVFCFFQQGDQGRASRGGFGEFDCCFHLGQHGAGGKLAVGYVFSRLLRRQVGEPLLVFLAEVDGYLFHRRRSR